MPIKGPGKEMQRRMAVLAVLACVIGFSAVVVRLLWMQVYQYDYYNTKASSLQTRDTILPPKRGTIYDSNMTELAVSASTERIEIYPSQFLSKDNENSNKETLYIPVEEQQERVAKLLSDVLGVDYETVLQKAQKTSQGGLSVAFGVEKEVADKLREEIKKAKDAYDQDTKRIKENGGGSYSDEAFLYGSFIGFVDDYRRYYPMGAFASQVIGFMEENEYPTGQSGIELEFESELAGSAGRVVRAADSTGGSLPVEAEQYVPAQDGNSIVLTIDSNIQEMLEKQLETALADNPQARGGVSGIVMDVKTGDILALSELPDFDPNMPRVISNEQQIENMKTDLLEELTEQEMDTTIMPSDEWFQKGGPQNLTENMLSNDKLIEILNELRVNALNDMWKIKPVTDKYEPGSTFKLLTVASAYEEQAVNENSTFFCGGSLRVDSETVINCHKKEGHGQQTLTEALMNSCNVAMMNIVFELGADKFYEYFDAFGLLNRTGIDLPGERDATPGVDMHSLETLQKTKSTLATTSFGQRFKVSPLQMLSTVCAIVDDGKLKTPHIVKEVLNADGSVKKTYETEVKRQVVSAETSAYMREAMQKVVSEGTGQNAYVAGYRIGGKTATSELSLPGTPTEDQRFTASFVGVAPMDDPQIAVLIIISDLPYAATHGGGAIAAPVVGRVMSDVLQYLDVEPVYDETESDRREMSTPRVIDMSKEDAEAAVEKAGLTCRFLGEGDTVSDQVPSAGQKIPVGSKMIIYLGDRTKTTEPVTVPKLVGRSPDEVEASLTNNNLYLRRTGVASSKYNWQTTAIKQNPAPGTKVAVGTVIEVEFSNTEGVNDR